MKMSKTRPCNLILGIWMFTPSGKRLDALALAHDALKTILALASYDRNRYLAPVWHDEHAPAGWPKSLVVREGDVSIPPWLTRDEPLPTPSPDWLARHAWLFAQSVEVETYCSRCGPRLGRTIVDTSRVGPAWPKDLEHDAGVLRTVMAVARMTTPPESSCHLSLGTIWADRVWERVTRVLAEGRGA